MKYFVLVICSLIIFHSCSDSTTEPNNNDLSLKTLKGKIQNYNLGDSVEVRLDRIYFKKSPNDSIIVISSGKINNDGSFSILLSSPPDFLLQEYPGCYENILSDSTTEVYLHSQFILYRNNIKIGFIYCSEKSFDQDPIGGQYIARLLYSNKDCKITGDCTMQGQTKTFVYKNNCEYYKGWNFVLQSLVENSDHLYISESKVNNNFQGNWFFKLSN
ncbi:MAG: hypothetical protein EHM44_11235 [Ignavibacteriales bacterium]|nr:MAG: hypothetical protein EHM44_11235 [Ignavibacteriales bacterium]